MQPQFPLSQTALREGVRRHLADGDEGLWLDSLSISLHDGNALVAFPHSYFGPWFLCHKRTAFEHALRELCGAGISFSYAYGEDVPEPQTPGDHCAYDQGEGGDDFASCDFDTFICDPKNAFALSAARQIAGLGGEPTFSPLVIHGESGSGKSHVLRAMAACLSSARRPGSVVCGGARRFCLECAYLERSPEIFWQDHEALLLDDVQDLCGEAALQRRLVAILDACPRQRATAMGGAWPMAFTLDRPPGRAGLDDRLATRLGSGLVVELLAPGLDVRLAYLQNIARERKLDPGRAALLRLARASEKLRILQGLWRRLEAFVRLSGRMPGDDDMERIILGGMERPLGFAEIVESVARQLRIGADEILGQGRRASIVRARQIAMYICRRKLGLSYPELGRMFGGRDHTTVLHAIRKIEKMMLENKDVHNLVTKLAQL